MSISQGPFPAVPGAISQISVRDPNRLQALRISNSSPFDLQYSGIGTGGVHWVVAGQEAMIRPNGENQGMLTVAVFNNAGITGTGNFLLTVYYNDEEMPQGTWPVTIPTQIVQAKVSSVTTLVNDGSAVSTQIIESTPSGAASSTISVLNDGTVTIKGDVAAILTTLLQLIPGAAGGASSVKLADAARQTEVLGSLLVDGASVLTGDVTANGAGVGLAVANNQTVGGTLGVTGITTHTGNVIANGGMNIATVRDNQTGADQMDLVTAGVTFNKLLTLLTGLNVTGITDSSGGFSIASNVLLSAAVNTHLAAVPGGQIIFDVTGTAGAGLIDARGVVSGGTQGFTFPSGGFLPNLSFFTGVGTGTYNHVFGSSPFWVCPITQVVGSATQGYDSVTSTQVHVTLGAANSFKAGCF